MRTHHKRKDGVLCGPEQNEVGQILRHTRRYENFKEDGIVFSYRFAAFSFVVHFVYLLIFSLCYFHFGSGNSYLVSGRGGREGWEAEEGEGQH